MLLNIVNRVARIKGKITYLVWRRLVILRKHVARDIYFFSPRKTLRRYPRGNVSPWRDISGILFIPGMYSLTKMCLQKINIASGNIQKKIFNESGHGHSVVCDKTGRGWLIPENGLSIVEFDFHTLHQRDKISSDGYLIGGHAACSPDGNRLYFVDRGINDTTLESNLIVYDVNRRKTIRKYAEIGIYPHDVKITKDERYAVVASYGRYSAFIGTKNYLRFSNKTSHLSRPSYAIIDLHRGEVIAKHTFDGNFMLAHADFDKNEQFVFIQGTNYIPLQRSNYQLIIQQRKIPLSEEEKLSRILFTPGLELKVSLQNAKLVRCLRHGFLRAQSLVFSKNTGLVYETFGVSNKVVVFEEDNQETRREFDFSHFGLADPRGLAFSADERFLFVSGRQHNIYCFDLSSRGQKETCIMYSNNNYNSHITLIDECR